MQRLMLRISGFIILGSLLLLAGQCGTSVPPGVEVVNIKEGQTIRNRITQHKTFNQCDLDSSFKAQIRFSQASGEETKQVLELGTNVGISQIARVELKREIEKRISSELVHDEGVEIEVPPRTQEEYTIVWQETRREGTVNYREDGVSKTADYSYRIGLELMSSGGKKLSCPGQTGSPPTNTPVPPPPTSTSTIPPWPPTLERIIFPPGATSSTFTTNLAQGVSKGYVLRILAQQHMFITITNGANIVVLDPEHTPLTPVSAEKGQWEVLIPRTGDYTVVIAGEGKVMVTIFIPPL